MRREPSVTAWTPAGPFKTGGCIFNPFVDGKPELQGRQANQPLEDIVEPRDRCRNWDVPGGLPGSGHLMERGRKVFPGDGRELSLDQLCVSGGGEGSATFKIQRAVPIETSRRPASWSMCPSSLPSPGFPSFPTWSFFLLLLFVRTLLPSSPPARSCSEGQ